MDAYDDNGKDYFIACIILNGNLNRAPQNDRNNYKTLIGVLKMFIVIDSLKLF